MVAQVKLLGPDLGSPLIVDMEATDTIAGLKDRALEKWPSGVCFDHLPLWLIRLSALRRV